MHVQRMYNSATYFQLRDATGPEPLTRDPTRPDPDAFWPGDPTRSLSARCFELRDYFDDGVLQVNAFWQKSGLCSTHTDDENFQHICKFI